MDEGNHSVAYHCVGEDRLYWGAYEQKHFDTNIERKKNNNFLSQTHLLGIEAHTYFPYCTRKYILKMILESQHGAEFKNTYSLIRP
jgi:hypothetical protein